MTAERQTRPGPSCPPQEARAFWLAAPGRGEIRAETLPPMQAGQVRVKTRFSGISRGTESLVFRGQVPASEYQRMRAPFQDGDFPAPVKYGYANVGEVIEGPEDLRGRAVFCLYPHQTVYQVPCEAVHLLPEGLPPSRAVLAANMETALNACWDAAIQAGDRVTVVGAGVVGALVAWLAARMPGCEVTLVDLQAGKADLAGTLGCRFAQPDQAEGEQDVVIHTSASEAGLAQALDLAGLEARVVEMSWYGQRQPGVPLGQAFHARRLELRSSQVGRLPAHQQARWDYRRRLTKALELLADPVLDALINAECRFDELPETLARLSAEPSSVMCQRVVYANTL
ncbi:MAG: zinc-dependent alcohol dehydrogenase [Wenzhouxiangella sp.]